MHNSRQRGRCPVNSSRCSTSSPGDPMPETLLPRDENEVRIVTGTRMMVMDELQPITPEEVEAAEQEALRRIALRLKELRTGEWVETQETDDDPIPERLYASDFNGMSEQMDKAARFLAMERNGSRSTDDAWYIIEATAEPDD